MSIDTISAPKFEDIFQGASRTLIAFWGTAGFLLLCTAVLLGKGFHEVSQLSRLNVLRKLYREIFISPMLYCSTAVVGLVSPRSVYLLNFLRALVLSKVLGAFLNSMEAVIYSKAELNIITTARPGNDEVRRGFCSCSGESVRKNELLLLYSLSYTTVLIVPSMNVINAWLEKEVSGVNLRKYLISTSSVALSSSLASIVLILLASRIANRYLKGMRMYSKSFGVCLFIFMSGVQPFIFNLVENYLENESGGLKSALVSFVDPRLDSFSSITIVESILVVLESVLCSILIYYGFNRKLIQGHDIKSDQVAPVP